MAKAKDPADVGRKGFFLRCTPQAWSVLKQMADAQRVTAGNVFERIMSFVSRLPDFPQTPYVLTDDEALETLGELMVKHERDHIFIISNLLRFAKKSPDVVAPYLVK